MDEKQLTKIIGNKTDLIDTVIAGLVDRVGKDQTELLRVVISDFVDKMDTEEGRIQNTTRNKRLISLLDEVYSKYVNTTSLATLATMVDGVQKVVNFNTAYFKPLANKTKLKPIDDTVKDTINSWLGLNTKGGVSVNGYLDTLIKDATVKNEIRNQVSNAVVTQAGYQETKDNLQNYIEGGDKETGALKKYYRNFVYDTFSHVDRAVGQMYADGLGFNYAIYEGGLIKTTRPFCRARNGKVFSRDEIAGFDPKTAKPPGYNPFIDLGGYGCRHHLNWIPDALAFALRPDLKLIEEAAKEERPAEKPVEEKPIVKPAAAERAIPAKKTPMAEIEPFKNPLYKPDKEDIKLIDSAAVGIALEDQVRADRSKLIQENNSLVGLLKRAYTQQGREELTARYNLIRKDLNAASARLDAVQKENEARGTVFRDKLIEGLTPGTVTIKNSPTLAKNKAFVKEYGPAVEFFKKLSAGYADQDSVDFIAARSRAFYRLGQVHISSNDKGQTIVHELGHSLEEHNFVYKAAVDFLNKRTEGKPARKLNTINKSYGSKEIYKEGGFYNPYVGKIYAGNSLRNYNGISYTEIISMGLDKMYSNPLEFYTKDPEHFSLIYNLFIKR